MTMDKACAKIIGRRWLGIKKPMPKAMQKPPIISGYTMVMAGAYAKATPPPKNGLAEPVIWEIKMTVINIVNLTNRAIDSYCIKLKKDVIPSFLMG